MSALYPAIEPYSHGMLDVGDGHQVYWEMCGNPEGKPALVVHGGPGSGCSPWWRQLFDPAAYRIVLFDQRNCGRSTPHAGAPVVDLSANTTDHLVADIERLREYLDIERWLVLGASWGSVLGLTYSERHPEHVSELVLFGVALGRYSELDWLFRGGIAILFPRQWEWLMAALPPEERAGDIVAAFARRLQDPDPEVHRPAADAWCLWESGTLSWPPSTGLVPRFLDPAYALAFARIVTHYISHQSWLEDGANLRGASKLAGIPGVLINGRFDFQAPIKNAWDLYRAWPTSELVVVENAGHSDVQAGIEDEVVRATDRFADAR
jgi:proline iminopeptidase